MCKAHLKKSAELDLKKVIKLQSYCFKDHFPANQVQILTLGQVSRFMALSVIKKGNSDRRTKGEGGGGCLNIS